MCLAPYLPGGMVVTIVVESATLYYIVKERVSYFYLITQLVPPPDPFGRGYVRPIGHIHRSHAVWRAKSTIMVVIFVGLLCWGYRYFSYYSYCRILRGGSFLFPPEPFIAVKLLNMYYGYGGERNRRQQKKHVKRWWIRLPCGSGIAMRGASPDGAHHGLHSKPLDAAIRHRASACIASPQRPPWLTILVEYTKRYQQTIFS